MLAAVRDATAGGNRVWAAPTFLCLYHFERGAFDECRRQGDLARATYAADMRYGSALMDLYVGMAEMARGRAREASERYARVRQDTKRYLPSDPSLAACADVATVELDLELNREKGIQQWTLTSPGGLRGAWADIYMAGVAVSAELMLAQYDGDSVIRMLRQVLLDVAPMGAEGLSNYMAGLTVFYLVKVGRPEEANELWVDRALPSDPSDLLDLQRQPWRTMEALSCARAALLAARGDLGGAQVLASGLCGIASEQGLTRVLLRGLALSMAIAHRAGQSDRAQARLIEFLGIVRDVGYVRPLVRDRDVSRRVLRQLLDTDIDPQVRGVAESMLPHLREKSSSAPVFSSREREVLTEIESGRSNREIADRLGISEPGVRFHVRNLYRKTGVESRAEVARTARSLGAGV